MRMKLCLRVNLDFHDACVLILQHAFAADPIELSESDDSSQAAHTVDSSTRKRSLHDDEVEATSTPMSTATSNVRGGSQQPTSTLSGTARKERQPNWNNEEIVALIQAKQKEQEKKLHHVTDLQNIEKADLKWQRISDYVAKIAMGPTYRGPQTCKDKWGALYGDYKRLKDYQKGNGNSENYYMMIGHRRRELNLPANFKACWFTLMDSFLAHRPCQNPPHQRDLLSDDDHVFMSDEDLPDFTTADSEDDGDQQYVHDATRTHTPESLGAEIGSRAGTSGAAGRPLRIPRRQHNGGPQYGAAGRAQATPTPVTPIPHDYRGKRFHVFSADSLTSGCRPHSTGVKRRQSNSQAKLVEVTETGGKELVGAINKIGDIEAQKIALQSTLCEKQIAYFQSKDSIIAKNQRGLIRAIQSLSRTMADALVRNNGPQKPTKVRHASAAGVEENLRMHMRAGSCLSPDADVDDFDLAMNNDVTPIATPLNPMPTAREPTDEGNFRRPGKERSTAVTPPHGDEDNDEIVEDVREGGANGTMAA